MPRRSRRRSDERSTPPRPDVAADPRLDLERPLRRLFPAGLPSPPPPPPPEPPPPPPPIAMTERDLMAAAYTGTPLDFDRIEIVAFTPPPPRPPAASASPPSASPPSASPPSAGDDAEPTPPPRPRAPLELGPFAGKSWRDHGVAPAPLDVDALSEDERELLADAARRPEVPTLRLRGMRRGPALVALAERVALARGRGLIYLRVVTGKGVGSPGAPILKEAVIAWCSGDGAAAIAGWAPERDRFGEYGALILRLRRRA